MKTSHNIHTTQCVYVYCLVSTGLCLGLPNDPVTNQQHINNKSKTAMQTLKVEVKASQKLDG